MAAVVLTSKTGGTTMSDKLVNGRIPSSEQKAQTIGAKVFLGVKVFIKGLQGSDTKR